MYPIAELALGRARRRSAAPLRGFSYDRATATIVFFDPLIQPLEVLTSGMTGLPVGTSKKSLIQGLGFRV